MNFLKYQNNQCLELKMGLNVYTKVMVKYFGKPQYCTWNLKILRAHCHFQLANSEQNRFISIGRRHYKITFQTWSWYLTLFCTYRVRTHSQLDIQTERDRRCFTSGYLECRDVKMGICVESQFPNSHGYYTIL